MVSDTAPLARYSTAWAAVTILAPAIRSPAPMPRGLAQVPQAQICPPFATNAWMTSRSGGKTSS